MNLNNKNKNKNTVNFYISFLIKISQWDTEPNKNLEPQPAITCSKLTIETLEQGAKYVQS